jgi:transcriptional regulator with PAS, ATPase and Fis domain
MRRIFELLPTIAASDSTVLLRGETGTGKNLVAKAIHGLSPRATGPFVTVNCGALPETLLESELFGYRAGAFTDAVRDRQGRIAAAEGGTLFLDEIGDLSQSAQVKLLRFLQDRVYERLGDDKPIAADVRVITATHRDLQQLMEQGIFRRDLYYRINVLGVELPALRERRGDIPLLVRRFLEHFSLNRRKHVTGVSPAVLEVLQAHDYPGNIRELENIIEHAFVLCPGPIIELKHLPQDLLARTGGRYPGLATNLAELEAVFIRDALERNGWNRQSTARSLGIHSTTLQRKIRRLGLELPNLDGRSSRRTRA